MHLRIKGVRFAVCAQAPNDPRLRPDSPNLWLSGGQFGVIAMNRDVPNCLRVVCRGGLLSAELGMAARVVYSYFQNWDDLVLPCVLDLCRRTGRPFVDRMHAAMNAGCQDRFPIEITVEEVSYMNCPLYIMMPDLNNFFTMPPLHLDPLVQHVVACLPMADSDAAFMARWSEAHNADWPDSRKQELRGLRRRTRALHIKSDFGHQLTSAIYTSRSSSDLRKGYASPRCAWSRCRHPLMNKPALASLTMWPRWGA